MRTISFCSRKEILIKDMDEENSKKSYFFAKNLSARGKPIQEFEDADAPRNTGLTVFFF